MDPPAQLPIPKRGGATMISRFPVLQQLALSAMILAAGAIWATSVRAQDASDKSLAEQIFAAMVQDPGTKPGHRVAHAKGIVCEGTFVPSPEAAKLSKAAHFQRASVPVTIRFSDGPADPFIADNSRDAGPRGMGVRFNLPGGQVTDVEGISHNGFAVGTGEEFLALISAASATNVGDTHPSPVEAFLAAHPRALNFVRETAAVP